MSKLKLAESTLSSLSLKDKKVVVIGGTSGIGEAVAKCCASLGANITIVGRNETAAKSILQDMSQYQGTHTFKKLDLSLISNCTLWASDFKKNESLDYLVITSGMARLGGRQETAEGLDDKMALHYYSRFALTDELSPLLEQVGQQQGKDARVLTVLHAGGGKLVDENDLDLKKNYGIKQCADACTFYNDLMVDSFSKLYPHVGYTHAYPGFVDTPLAKGSNFPWILQVLMRPLSGLFGTPASDCAKLLVAGWLQPEKKTGYHLMDQYGDVVANTRDHTPLIRDKVFHFTKNLLKSLRKE